MNEFENITPDDFKNIISIYERLKNGENVEITGKIKLIFDELQANSEKYLLDHDTIQMKNGDEIVKSINHKQKFLSYYSGK